MCPCESRRAFGWCAGMRTTLRGVLVGCRRLGNISQLSQSSLVRRNRPSPDAQRLQWRQRRYYLLTAGCRGSECCSASPQGPPLRRLSSTRATQCTMRSNRLTTASNHCIVNSPGPMGLLEGPLERPLVPHVVVCYVLFCCNGK